MKRKQRAKFCLQEQKQAMPLIEINVPYIWQLGGLARTYAGWRATHSCVILAMHNLQRLCMCRLMLCPASPAYVRNMGSPVRLCMRRLMLPPASPAKQPPQAVPLHSLPDYTIFGENQCIHSSTTLQVFCLWIHRMYHRCHWYTAFYLVIFF